MTDAVTTEHIDRVLQSLSDDATIASSGNARLVIVPTGVFVVLPATIDVVGTADEAHWLANATRDALATHLAWVPFVDAVVVCSRHPGPMKVAATVVPLDLLGELLREGMNVIEPTLLAKMYRLLDGDGLSSWSTEIQSVDGTINLCDPILPTVEI